MCVREREVQADVFWLTQEAAWEQLGRANDIIHRERERERERGGGGLGAFSHAGGEAGQLRHRAAQQWTVCMFECGITELHPAGKDIGLHLEDCPSTFLFFSPLYLSPSPPLPLILPSSSGCFLLLSAPASGGSSGHAP